MHRSSPCFIALFVLVILAAFWLRVADLNTIPPGLHFDEAENLQRAWRLNHSYGLMPNFEGIPEPFDAHIRAAFLSFVGITPFTGRLFSGFLGILATAAVMALARALYWRHPQREWIALVAGITLAALPPYVIIGRAIYAANWIPFTSAIALTALIWAWRSNRLRYFVIGGIFTALTMIFYLAGIAFPLAFALVLGLLILQRGRPFRWPRFRDFFWLILSGLITLLPWLYLFIRIPGWLVQRIEALTIQNFNPVTYPTGIISQIQQALQPIFIANTVPFPVYNPYTTGFLNPPLVLLFAIGVLITFWCWRKPGMLIPLIVFAVMIAPNILSNRPEQPVRMVGIYTALALLVGLGAGELLTFLRKQNGYIRRLGWGILAAALIYTPLNTHIHIWFHFLEQPRLLNEPASVFGWVYLFGEGYQDMLQQIAEAPQPVYIPVDYLNTNRAIALLRPYAFPNVLAYDGRPLPDGVVYRPDKSVTYGFPELDTTRPLLQYALMLPDSGEILILPPLPTEKAQNLEASLASDGHDLTTSQGWLIGRQMPIQSADNSFVASTAASDTPLAVFDDRLELLSIDAPPALTPGTWIPITLCWRLLQPTGEDYFIRLQLRDFADQSRGTQRDSDGLILRYLFPTVMWQPNEIVTETRWIQVYDDAPAGGYRFAISVNTYPGPQSRAYTLEAAITADGEWVLVGQTSIASDQFAATAQPAQLTDIQFGDSIHLVGVTFEPALTDLQPGQMFTAHLFWSVTQPVAESYTLFLHLQDSTGALVDQRDLTPFDGVYPTWAWQPGQIIETAHTLTASGETPYTLALGLYQQPTFNRLPAFRDNQPQLDNIVTFP